MRDLGAGNRELTRSAPMPLSGWTSAPDQRLAGYWALLGTKKTKQPWGESDGVQDASARAFWLSRDTSVVCLLPAPPVHRHSFSGVSRQPKMLGSARIPSVSQAWLVVRSCSAQSDGVETEGAGARLMDRARHRRLGRLARLHQGNH